MNSLLSEGEVQVGLPVVGVALDSLLETGERLGLAVRALLKDAQAVVSGSEGRLELDRPGAHEDDPLAIGTPRGIALDQRRIVGAGQRREPFRLPIIQAFGSTPYPAMTNWNQQPVVCDLDLDDLHSVTAGPLLPHGWQGNGQC